jgi:hypothetical protein
LVFFGEKRSLKVRIGSFGGMQIGKLGLLGRWSEDIELSWSVPGTGSGKVLRFVILFPFLVSLVCGVGIWFGLDWLDYSVAP